MSDTPNRHVPEQADRPLLLRRRRDGVLVSSGPLPDRFEFQHSWLLGAGAGIATLHADDTGADTVHIELADVRASYLIVERTDRSMVGVLEDAEPIEPPPLDEDRAADLQAERRARVIADVAARYGVDTATAARIAVDTGQLPPSAAGGGDRDAAEVGER